MSKEWFCLSRSHVPNLLMRSPKSIPITLVLRRAYQQNGPSRTEIYSSSFFTPSIPINSVSKTTADGSAQSLPMPKCGQDKPKVLPAGIGPMALWPYPNSGGMVSFRLSPMHISRRPSSHLGDLLALASHSDDRLILYQPCPMANETQHATRTL